MPRQPVAISMTSVLPEAEELDELELLVATELLDELELLEELLDELDEELELLELLAALLVVAAELVVTDGVSLLLEPPPPPQADTRRLRVNREIRLRLRMVSPLFLCISCCCSQLNHNKMWLVYMLAGSKCKDLFTRHALVLMGEIFLSPIKKPPLCQSRGGFF